VTYVITQTCINEQDQSCVEVCPVDCIHFEEGTDLMLYIDPTECIDCGACVPVCPVDAIYADDEVPADQSKFTEINSLWFDDRAAARGKVGDAPAAAPAAASTESDEGDATEEPAAVAAPAAPAAAEEPAVEENAQVVIGAFKQGEAGVEGKCALCGTYVIKGGSTFRHKSVICSDCADKQERIGDPFKQRAGSR
jgi:ferredoxin